MNAAEFSAWLQDPTDNYAYEGMQSLIECYDHEHEGALQVHAGTASASGQAPAIMGMLADAIMCQSCSLQRGQYQCVYCLRVNCTVCTTDDPERVACRLPCLSTELRPTKRIRVSESLRSVNRVMVPECTRALGSESWER